MNPALTWMFVISASVTVLGAVFFVDAWMDRRPGGRKADSHLDHLREQEAYRDSLRRIYEHQDQSNVQIGRRDRRDV